MWQDKRSGKITVVAHCILNQNSRVFGLAQTPATINEVANIFMRHSVGIIQMPCPELTHVGLRRQSQTKEQYDTVPFRRHCQQIANTIADQIQEYSKNGMKVLAVIGVDGSPTCSVNEPPGILIESLQDSLRKRRIHMPFYGIRHERINEDAIKLEKLIEQTE